MIVGLSLILVHVLFLPFLVKPVERNLEIFLCLMGLAAANISGVLDASLIIKAWQEPIYISLAVLVAGLLFKWFANPIETHVISLSQVLPIRILLGLVVIILGLISSIITAIIASLLLVSIVSILRLDRQSELIVVVLACYSIGLGAALTPIGEPLATIAISKLNEPFSYMFTLLGGYVLPGLLLFGVLTAIMVKPIAQTASLHVKLQARKKIKESYEEIFSRTVKVYLFVMGLTFLGTAFEPLIKMYLAIVSPEWLFWLNMISAVLDNATLAAAELSPLFNDSTIRAILMGLLISGGMLIPGNIPNIIAAGKLNITSKEWARYGVPIGLAAMFVYFVFLFLLK